MHYPSVVVVVFAACTLAAPAPIAFSADSPEASSLEARDDTVTCSPKSNKSDTKKFKVDVSYAKSQASKAALITGISGDPHNYGGGDNIEWGVRECDVKDAPLWEYPVFWQGSKGRSGQLEWDKDLKTSKQKMKTPLRVVYVNQNGGAKYCGIMTHSEVTDEYQGKDFFQRCD
ncbi:Ribonuclease/ribotoxin [Boeremia exigua]|uniref:Ribonuclease/ribotoxin n=1 Tax=Boeremia exigua TaxID=749465 RepID=UPI001E8DDDFF|nr:Ribonuclease/ribotoxin [Boeremia exigua]KAH6644823.1 Ribonuclease/ribotoxin [Boeremia exigua]